MKTQRRIMVVMVCLLGSFALTGCDMAKVGDTLSKISNIASIVGNEIQNMPSFGGGCGVGGGGGCGVGGGGGCGVGGGGGCDTGGGCGGGDFGGGDFGGGNDGGTEVGDAGGAGNDGGPELLIKPSEKINEGDSPGQ